MGGCSKCISRMPYGTVIATALCCVGVLTFLICLYKGVKLTLRMFEEVFTYNLEWVNDIGLVFIIVGAFMGLLAVTLLVVGIFSTGATRTKIYSGWKARVGGRICSSLCMMLVYILHIVWLIMCCILVVVVFVFHVWKNMCEVATDCVDLQQFVFLFPNGTDINHLRICEKKKNFCTDTVQYAMPYYILALAASFVVVISLVNYIMCLAANYTRIKDQEKLKDFQELQYLQEGDMGTLPKDRY